MGGGAGTSLQPALCHRPVNGILSHQPVCDPLAACSGRHSGWHNQSCSAAQAQGERDGRLAARQAEPADTAAPQPPTRHSDHAIRVDGDDVIPGSAGGVCGMEQKGEVGRWQAQRSRWH